jgi:pimeloyl-ACP methyl ester carboxylesterase
LILVHGFNNHAGEAAIAYLGFREAQCDRFADLKPDILEKLLGDTFWPGDAKWAGPLDLVDFLVYPAAVGTAKAAGPLLGDMVLEFSKLDKVHFIGHSLGCRVVLETLDYLLLKGFSLSRVGGVCLMAAAVPIYMVQEGGKFASLLDRLGTSGGKILVLHSTSDPVLHFAFGPGQTAAGKGEGWFPTALGRFGPPPGMRGIHDDEPIEGAGHSDYWGWNKSSASKEATGAVGDFFKLGDRPREHKPRKIGIARDVAWARDATKNE